MKRLVLLALLAGCTEPTLTVTPVPTEAEQLFADEVLPMLEANCVACHSGNSGGGEIGFLAGDTWQEVRETLLSSQVIAPDVTNSRLLTKGAHSGPHLSAEQVSLLLHWLDSEGY